MSDPVAQFNPPIGHAIELCQGLRRIVAPNASPMTYTGTNTYLLGENNIAVIDPGPDDDAHLNSILQATNNGKNITHILVTHAHVDHSLLALKLGQKTGSPVLAYGPAHRGQSEIMLELLKQGFTQGGEGIDHNFVPDQILNDQEQIKTSEWNICVHHTPGHMANHLCFEWDGHLFTGDHIMGWATSMVSPPDGDLTQFMDSCTKLSQKTWRLGFAGHGDTIPNLNGRIDELITHRKSREAQILKALNNGPSNIENLTQMIYLDINPHLLIAASRNVFAHLIDLVQRDKVNAKDSIGYDTEFTLK